MRKQEKKMKNEPIVGKIEIKNFDVDALKAKIASLESEVRKMREQIIALMSENQDLFERNRFLIRGDD